MKPTTIDTRTSGTHPPTSARRRKRGATGLAILAAQALLVGAALALVGVAAQAADNPVEKVSVKAVAHFGFDGTTISPADQAKILAEVGQMKDVTWQTVRSTGYTDSVGPVAYNEALADRRAAKVKSYLVGKGLDSSMIKTEAKGPSEPVADNATPQGRAQNRRAEIEFLGVRSASK